jgi:transcriptional regulator with XRE-family HTH domain/tetratricopeptide (TPR) repeat protein
MEQRQDPPWPEALKILREIRGWNQLELSRAAGVSPPVISKYESGDRTPDSNLTRLRLLAAMGFPGHLLERTYSFIRSARAAREHELAAAAGALQARIDGFVAEAGLWMEDLVRDVLVSALGEARGPERGRSAPPPGIEEAEEASVESAPLTAPHPSAPDRPTLPPLGKALVILRVIRGWERDDLARAAAVSGEMLASYERAKTKPALPVLDRLIAALGFPPAIFDRCLAFVESAREASRLHLATGEDALRAQAAEIAARHARLAEEHARLRLDEISAAARLLVSRSLAPAAWAALAACSDQARRGLVQHARQFQTAGLCELVCDMSLAAACDSAERARRLAELAVEIAERLPGSEGWRSRLLGYAGFHLANSLRVDGNDLPAAAAALERARGRWEAGATDDPGLLNAARVMSLEASLLRAQRRLPEALALLDQALAIDRWGETPSLLLGKARVLFERGDYEPSIGVLSEAVPQIDAEREPRQRCVALDLLLHDLCLLGRHAEAAAKLGELRALGRRLGNRLDLLRLAWLEGKIAAGTGRLEEAIATLERVRETFVALNSSYDVALVTVELAEILVGLGRNAEVRALAQASVPMFRDQGVHVEAQRALELICRAAEEERASAEQLRGVLAYLYRARYNPHLRFDTAA